MSRDHGGTSSAQKRCFVVMGFGVKTDLATGRKLDLDKSYRALIKPVVEQKGLLCIRADEIRHSGTIDLPMYQELLGADVVIADVSTANPNALYELGIRHALRPRTTIVISESKLSYPFDLNHIAITSYTHLCNVIDYDEVIRFQKILGDTLETVLRSEMVDSPVYTYLTNLDPPALRRQAEQAATRAGEALAEVGKAIRQAVAAPSAKPDQAEQTLAMLVAQGEEALAKDRFIEAKGLFGAALQICKKKNKPNVGALAHDPYLIQRLTLATYKSKQPDQVSALNEALGVLDELDPAALPPISSEGRLLT